MEDATAADALNVAADNLEQRISTPKESAKLSEQAMALRRELSADNPNSLKFRPMTFAEQMTAKTEAVWSDWQRAQQGLEGPVVVGDFTYSGELAVINTASYAELKWKKKFEYEPTANPDDFETNILKMYHGGLMYDEDTPGAKRVTRFIHGGPLLHYISRHPGLGKMKERLIKARGFWLEHSEYQHTPHANTFTLNSSLSNNRSSPPFLAAKPYRDALVKSGKLSTASASDPEAIEHHKKVRQFFSENSEVDMREYVANHVQTGVLSCIYEVHRDDADDDATTTRTKVGKANSTNKTVDTYFDDNTSRRNPFLLDGEDGSPPPDSVNGNMFLIIDAPGTLFDQKLGKALSNYLIEFLEGIVTAAMFPTLLICPSISMLGDAHFGTDDPKFFDTCRYLLNKIIDGKFKVATTNVKRDAAYSEEEWAEAITLSDWYYDNIHKPRKNGSLLPHREEFLESMGFDRIFKMNFSKNATWMENFRDIKNHADAKGFREWPTKKMTAWASEQRRVLGTGGCQVKTAELRAKNQWRIDLLNSIGFPWEVKYNRSAS